MQGATDRAAGERDSHRGDGQRGEQRAFQHAEAGRAIVRVAIQPFALAVHVE